MNYVTLDLVDNIFDCARRAIIEVHYVDDAKFQGLCISLKEFERSLGEEAQDDFWKPFLRALKRYCFERSSTPLPFNNPADLSPTLIERLQRLLRHCDSIFPQFADHARELTDIAEVVYRSHSNPMLAACGDILSQGGLDAAVLIKEPRLIPSIEDLLGDEFGSGMPDIVAPSQLRGHSWYSRLIVLGPTRWYPDYVFRSPRARRIDIVRYRWINDRNPPSQVFTGSVRHSYPDWIYPEEADKDNPHQISLPSSQSLDAEDLLPSISWDDVLRMVSARVSGEVGHTDAEEEYVTARLFQLEGELVIPLDATEGASATVLILTQQDADPVRRMPVTSLEPDMFLLVRTGGGGEYITLLADRILGEHSSKAREVQRDWKDRLRNRVRQVGLPQVLRDLRRCGSRRANQVNVRNWMSYRSIKTEDQRDFRAVMELVGLADSFDEYWRTMTLIDRAHRRAGQFTRKQLLAEVRSANLQELDKLGRMDFELPGAEGVNLTAVRITGVHPQIFEIDVARLGHPLELDGNLWPG